MSEWGDILAAKESELSPAPTPSGPAVRWEFVEDLGPDPWSGGYPGVVWTGPEWADGLEALARVAEYNRAVDQAGARQQGQGRGVRGEGQQVMFGG